MSLLWVGGRRVFGMKAQPWGPAWLSVRSLARRERRAGLGEELSTAAAGSRPALLLETALEPAHQAHTWLLRNAGQRVMSLCSENTAGSFHGLHPASPCACREVRERIAGTFCALQPTRSKAGWGHDGHSCCPEGLSSLLLIPLAGSNSSGAVCMAPSSARLDEGLQTTWGNKKISRNLCLTTTALLSPALRAVAMGLGWWEWSSGRENQSLDWSPCERVSGKQNYF